MYFYVDESGHTGPNIFDSSQPILYYGVLSSSINLDTLPDDPFAKLRKKLGVDRLHAAELGNHRLASIVDDLLVIQKTCDIAFDIYSVVKADHALICFFDQVFDQGLNPAVPWAAYWTPLRYVALLKLAWLFDAELLKRAWEARIDCNDNRANKTLVSVCQTIRRRVSALPDARSRQIISDSLHWVEKHPEAIHYNVKSKNELLQITPNIIGFQSVMFGIVSRLKTNGVEASQIMVDRQSQFNKAQRTLFEYFQRFASSRKSSFFLGPGLPDLDFTGMPEIPLSFPSRVHSSGLQLVDIYLWVFKRMLEEQELAPQLLSLSIAHVDKVYTDEISIAGILRRWTPFFENLPEPNDEQMERAHEIIAKDETRRLRALEDYA